MYCVIYNPGAVQRLIRLPDRTVEPITMRIAEYARDPEAPRADVHPLIQRPGYQLRIGSWRVSFALHHDAQTIDVFAVEPSSRYVTL